MAKREKAPAAQVAVGEPEEEKAPLVIPANAVIDVAVTVISLDGDPFHETGTEFEMGKKTAEEQAKLGRVKIKEAE